jgi:aldehyde:ferredoxin oxidoreductase
MFTAVWDRQATLDDLILAGERIFNLKRLLNLKLGLNPRRDEVMPKLLTVPLADGPTDGFVPDWEMMLKEYYHYRDWDWDTGRPSPQKLAQLGLADLVE